MSELRDDLAAAIAEAIGAPPGFVCSYCGYDAAAAADAVLALLRPRLIPEGMTAHKLRAIAVMLETDQAYDPTEAITELRAWADVLPAGYSKET